MGSWHDNTLFLLLELPSPRFGGEGQTYPPFTIINSASGTSIDYLHEIEGVFYSLY